MFGAACVPKFWKKRNTTSAALRSQSIVNETSIDLINFEVGDGITDDSIVFSGPLDAVNSAIYNISYEPDLNWNGFDTLVMIATDMDTRPLVHEVEIEVVAVNDKPIITVDEGKDGYQTNQETPRSVYVGNRAIVIDDVDFYEDFDVKCQLNISAMNGKMSLGWMEWGNNVNYKDTGVIFVETDMFMVNNDILPNLVYTPKDKFVGIDNITIIFSDLVCCYIIII